MTSGQCHCTIPQTRVQLQSLNGCQIKHLLSTPASPLRHFISSTPVEVFSEKFLRTVSQFSLVMGHFQFKYFSF